VMNHNGDLMFRLHQKASWPQMFNWSGSPHLFVTEGDEAAFYNADGNRFVVASDVPCYRGALFLVDGALWALTISIVDGITYGFARPWQDTQGIRVDMWGGFAEALCPDGQFITCQGYNQDTGEIICCHQVPVDSARKDITETPDYGTAPPMLEPIIYVDAKPGQEVRVRYVA
jgi:hypothetical protein